MGEKKQKEERSKKIKQILIVGACVLFVVLMVVSAMGSGWITGLAVIKPGDAVVLDYTLYNPDGKAIVTSDQQLWKAGAATGTGPLLTKQLSIVANQSYAKGLYPVPVYTSSGNQQFAVFTQEYTAITQGVIGMKVNEKKTIVVPARTPMLQVWDASQLKRQNLSIADLRIGDLFTLGVSDNPVESATNISSSYVRLAEVTKITADNITVDFGYPRVDISIATVNGR